MSRIFFFDLDETLRQTKSGKTFISEPNDQQPIEGAQKAVTYYASKGFVCIGISNQVGVAAGHKSIESAIEEQRITLELFPELSAIYFCPNYSGESCWVVGKTQMEFKSPDISCRKPSHGMILCAANPWIRRESIDFSECWMVGDRPEDFECAKNAGINFIWADIMLDKFKPGIHERSIANIDRETLLKFLAL